MHSHYECMMNCTTAVGGEDQTDPPSEGKVRGLERLVAAREVLLQLRQREHGHEACADEVRAEVAVLDAVCGADRGAQEAEQGCKADVERQGRDAPLVEGRRADQEDEHEHVGQLEEHGPDPARNVRIRAEGPAAGGLNHLPHGDAWRNGVEQQRLGVGEGEDEGAEGLTVLADDPGLLPAEEHERLGAPEEDEGVRQAGDHRAGLQSVQGP
mmetsp:Transcript_2713/g.5559  ORF Transcript_2713/g.5559 Transcript_2713/m.5559 type:complete len:212 (-) Transcript_2713:4-639(-)